MVYTPEIVHLHGVDMIASPFGGGGSEVVKGGRRRRGKHDGYGRTSGGPRLPLAGASESPVREPAKSTAPEDAS